MPTGNCKSLHVPSPAVEDRCVPVRESPGEKGGTPNDFFFKNKLIKSKNKSIFETIGPPPLTFLLSVTPHHYESHLTHNNNLLIARFCCHAMTMYHSDAATWNIERGAGGVLLDWV